MGKKTLKSDFLVWMDLEMTGLDPTHCVILEIGTVVTDNQLKVVADGPNIAIHYPEKILKSMEPWSAKHHGVSGLTRACQESRISLKMAERMTLDFIKCYCRKKTAVLCGNSIWQDRRFLSKYMPKLDSYLHYRMIDVSSIKEIAGRWYPKFTLRKKEGCHRAAFDIHESISELKAYRDNIFVKP